MVTRASVAGPVRVRRRLTRAELAPIAREAIFNAAARVVGELGYAEASVARITAAAGIAQGTFYLYFPTRQSLFDELLPHARREMLALVRERVAGARDFFDMEERGIAAFLEYVRRNPGFLRILSEAQAAAPEAWRQHYDDVARRFRRELQQAAAAGQVSPMDEGELHSAVYLMMGARVSLVQRLSRGRPAGDAAARAVVGHYMRMVRAWLAAPPPPARRSRAAAAHAAP